MKQIEVVAAIIRDEEALKREDELGSVKWLSADVEVAEKMKKQI